MENKVQKIKDILDGFSDTEKDRIIEVIRLSLEVLHPPRRA